MIKKTFMATIIIAAFLVSLVAGMQAIKLDKAQGLDIIQTEVPPPDGTIPPVISILSLTNNTEYVSHWLTLAFTIDIIQSNNLTFHFGTVSYRPSWQSDNITVDITPLITYESQLVQLSIPLTNVPEGHNWIEIYSTVHSEVETSRETGTTSQGIQGLIIHENHYLITGSSLVNFTIDTTPPKVKILLVENKTYNSDTESVPLSVNVNETTSWIGYSLDNQANITLTENTTLSGPTTELSDGYHNITIYANDTAGNIGKSETAYFTTETTHTTTDPFLTPSLSPTQQPTIEPSQTPDRPRIGDFAPVLIPATMILLGIIAVGLMVYFRRRRG